jgi:hypothetical protein
MCADLFHRHNTSEPDWKQLKLDLVTAMGRRHMLLGWKQDARQGSEKTLGVSVPCRFFSSRVVFSLAKCAL